MAEMSKTREERRAELKRLAASPNGSTKLSGILTGKFIRFGNCRSGHSWPKRYWTTNIRKRRNDPERFVLGLNTQQTFTPAQRGCGGKLPAMYHTIEFDEPLTLDLEVSARQPLERVSVKKGTRHRAQIKPYVVETEVGPVEVVDLFFEDGTTTRRVRFSSFSFIEIE